MLGVLQGFSVVLGIIAAGYLITALGVIKGDQRKVLNDVAFYVATPALLFGVLRTSDPMVVFSPVILVSTAASLIAATLYVAASRLWFKRDLASVTLGAAASSYPNAANMGLPVAIYILGDAAYMAPIILIQAIVFTPVILSLLEATRGPARSVSARGLLTASGRGLASPIVIASLIGFACAIFAVPVPESITEPLDIIGGAAIPLILMVFGSSLRGQRPLQVAQDRAPTIAATVSKLLVMPVVSYLLAVAFGLTAHEIFIATVLGTLPTAQNIFNFAEAYRRAETQVRDTVLLTTFGSLPIIALAAWLLGP